MSTTHLLIKRREKVAKLNCAFISNPSVETSTRNNITFSRPEDKQTIRSSSMSRVTSFMVGIVTSSLSSFFILEEIRDRQCIDTAIQRKNYENKINDVLFKYELSQRINNRHDVSNLCAEKSRNLMRLGGLILNYCHRTVLKFVDQLKQLPPKP